MHQLQDYAFPLPLHRALVCRKSPLAVYFTHGDIHILVYNQIFFKNYDSFLSMQMFYHLNALRYFYKKDIRSFDKLRDNKI